MKQQLSVLMRAKSTSATARPPNELFHWADQAAICGTGLHLVSLLQNGSYFFVGLWTIGLLDFGLLDFGLLDFGLLDFGLLDFGLDWVNGWLSFFTDQVQSPTVQCPTVHQTIVVSTIISLRLKLREAKAKWRLFMRKGNLIMNNLMPQKSGLAGEWLQTENGVALHEVGSFRKDKFDSINWLSIFYCTSNIFLLLLFARKIFPKT